ncbi:hypothetical protein [Pedobacter paludis]|uniref:Uncharacterized protein n=1 Tax=Pedobacter paludis TaxID=2203212 RepID=A0A317EWI3_9SPHI|nr:hypothetical protein [Pedobacter paludis]PWS30905.1 hypothetical protein DF947_14975 [Pedobacter paludis]
MEQIKTKLFSLALILVSLFLSCKKEIIKVDDIKKPDTADLVLEDKYMLVKEGLDLAQFQMGNSFVFDDKPFFDYNPYNNNNTPHQVR